MPRRRPDPQSKPSPANPKLEPLGYLLSVMNDASADPGRRDRAARTAAPYVHRRADGVSKKAKREAAAKKAGGAGTGWNGDLDVDGHSRN